MSFPTTSPGSTSLGYMGTKNGAPIALVSQTRDPQTSDARAYDIGTIWVNKLNNNAWILTSKPGNIAYWLPFVGGSLGVTTLTPDVGGPIAPVLGNIDLDGGPGLQITGAGNTITVTAPGLAQSTLTTKFTANGVWTKNPAAKQVRLIMWGAAGGGGTAAGAGIDVWGGSGGAAGQGLNYLFDAAVFPALSTITIGVGGTGGLGTAVAPGNNGTAGTDTIVQTLSVDVTVNGGSGGQGGDIVNVVTTAASQDVMDFIWFASGDGGTGGRSAAVGDPALSPQVIFSPGFANGGGGGGGVDNTDVDGVGANGGTIRTTSIIVNPGGAGGGLGGNGGNGTNFSGAPFNVGGSGGGGGGGFTVGNGGNGGDGAIQGGGGGGGASCRSPFTGGNGGDGARGEVWIYEYF